MCERERWAQAEATAAPLPFEDIKIPVGPPHICLTFDDGPNNYTETVLGMLEKREIKAVFFITGPGNIKNLSLERRKSIVAAILDQGHEIGNHGDDHNPYRATISKGEKRGPGEVSYSEEYPKLGTDGVKGDFVRNEQMYNELMKDYKNKSTHQGWPGFHLVRLPGDGSTFPAKSTAKPYINMLVEDGNVHVRWHFEFGRTGGKDPWQGIKIEPNHATADVFPSYPSVVLFHEHQWSGSFETLGKVIDKLMTQFAPVSFATLEAEILGSLPALTAERTKLTASQAAADEAQKIALATKLAKLDTKIQQAKKYIERWYSQVTYPKPKS